MYMWVIFIQDLNILGYNNQKVNKDVCWSKEVQNSSEKQRIQDLNYPAPRFVSTKNKHESQGIM